MDNKSRNNLLIIEPISLYREFRKEKYSNPLKWFLHGGFIYPAVFLLFCSIAIVQRGVPYTYNQILRDGAILIIGICIFTLPMYIISFFSYEIQPKVLFKSNGIWLKRIKKVINYSVIKAISFKKYSKLKTDYIKVTIQLTNDITYSFYMGRYDKSHDIYLFLQSVQKKYNFKMINNDLEDLQYL